MLRGLAGLVAAVAFLAASGADAGVGVATCNQARWCTVTSSGYVTAFASQLAIGNAEAGTALAVTEDSVGQKQLGGQFLNGRLAGLCGWSQYQRDWTSKAATADVGCGSPVINTDQFVAANGTAIWSGCYPRCFGGVPLRLDRHCGERGHTWCYGRDCEEYANYFPWSPSAHPVDPIRRTAGHRLDIRYLARYGDVWTNNPFYLVRDQAAHHGSGNWVFVSGAACSVRVGHPGTYHWLPNSSRTHGARRTAATTDAPSG